jgi:hypothetical protein
MEAVRGTNGHTSRFQSLVNAVLAVITLNHFPDFRVPLGSPPGTGGHAGFAAHTEIVVYENNAVFGTFLHGTGWACSNTPGVFAMETWHKDIGCLRHIIHDPWPDGQDLADPRAQGQIFVALAYHFTTVTSNTILGILK